VRKPHIERVGLEKDISNVGYHYLSVLRLAIREEGVEFEISGALQVVLPIKMVNRRLNPNAVAGTKFVKPIIHTCREHAKLNCFIESEERGKKRLNVSEGIARAMTEDQVWEAPWNSL
jgi:hypothetical protein